MAIETKRKSEPLYHPPGAFDLLRVPGLGRLLRWRWGRLVLQLPLFILAALVIYDGFTGPQRAAENLATVTPWVHYRGLVVIALLLAGNLFCMGCPFTLPRTLAKRLSIRGRRFPQMLRNKWVAIAGLFVMFFLYEWLDLWASPVLTAWVVVFYFVASFVLEAMFAESPFCKYVCPLGAFNFAYSTASPLQITMRDGNVCAHCVGKECVNGSYATTSTVRVDEMPLNRADNPQYATVALAEIPTVKREVTHDKSGTPGCGTLLFVPQIQSNLDCIFCLDCARACPHDNVALIGRKPGRELFNPEAWPKRWDVSFFIIILAFMGVSNAFGMVPPVFDLMRDIGDILGTNSEFIVLLLLFLLLNIALPVILTLGVGQLVRILTNTTKKYSLRHTVAAFAPAFVPIGFGIWFAHYAFHFLIGIWTIIPVFQTFLIDHRIYLLGTEPDWSLAGFDVGVVGLVQVAALVGGFLWSMMLAQRISLRLYRRQAMVGLLPWAALLLALMFVALQIFGLPMEMRGTVFS